MTERWTIQSGEFTGWEVTPMLRWERRAFGEAPARLFLQQAVTRDGELRWRDVRVVDQLPPEGGS